MDDQEKEKKIQGLIDPEYGHLILQELISEILIEANKNKEKSLSAPYKKILKLILGEPNIKNEFSGYQDDEYYLEWIAFIEKNNPNAINDTERTALREVVRMKNISGYKLGDDFLNDKDMPKDIFDMMESDRNRIGPKFKKIDVDEYSKRFQYRSIENAHLYDHHLEEVVFTYTFLNRWLHKYGDTAHFRKIIEDMNEAVEDLEEKI